MGSFYSAESKAGQPLSILGATGPFLAYTLDSRRLFFLCVFLLLLGEDDSKTFDVPKKQSWYECFLTQGEILTQWSLGYQY